MRVALLLLGLSVLANTARANDTAMGGQGANLVPLQTSAVFMQSEDITLTLTGVEGDPGLASGEAREREKWRVEAHYVFTNPSQRVVKLQLGFPEYRCETRDEESREFCPSDRLFQFEEMQTWVRGELVPQRKGRVSAKHAWAPLLGGVWLFDLTLAPGEQVPVTHRYRVPTTLDSSGGRSVHYVTRTGALWARPIERARFTYRYPARVCTLYPPDDVSFASFRLFENAADWMAEVSYEARDWKPRADLRFYAQPCHVPRDYFENDRQKLCPAHALLAGYAYGPSEWNREPAPSREVVLAQLSTLSEDALRLCQNYPYAAYGRPFADTALAEAFYGVPVPQPTSDILLPFKPSAHYTEKLLQPAEWRWIKIVEEAAAQRKRAASPPAEPTPPVRSGSCSGCALQQAGEPVGFVTLGVLLLLALGARIRASRRKTPAQPAS